MHRGSRTGNSSTATGQAGMNSRPMGMVIVTLIGTLIDTLVGTAICTFIGMLIDTFIGTVIRTLINGHRHGKKWVRHEQRANGRALRLTWGRRKGRQG